MIVRFWRSLYVVGLDVVEEGYSRQEKELIRSKEIIRQSGASMSLEHLLSQIISLLVLCLAPSCERRSQIGESDIHRTSGRYRFS